MLALAGRGMVITTLCQQDEVLPPRRCMVRRGPGTIVRRGYGTIPLPVDLDALMTGECRVGGGDTRSFWRDCCRMWNLRFAERPETASSNCRTGDVGTYYVIKSIR